MIRTPVRLRLAAALFTVAVVGCAPAASSQQQPVAAPTAHIASGRPRLVVLLTIDQFRADYVPRWSRQLTGGIGRLVAGGAYFPVAVHDHGITTTAPGHATIGSGRFPRSTGITSNEAGVGDTSVVLVEGVGLGASPQDFVGTTLADWIAAADPNARVLSVSYKDRAAILPVGRRPAADVYWYSGVGLFTTSTYYRSALPQWVRAFNERGLAHSYAERVWTLSRPESEYPEPDNVPAENEGHDFLFPHSAVDTPPYAPTVLESTPWIDELTLEFALTGVRALDLGRGERTDFLSVSLSGTDKVGHRYGPDSRELHDQVLRLDSLLGDFLDSVFALVGEENVVIALTSDHGVAPLEGVIWSADRVRGRRVSLAPPVIETRGRIVAAGGDAASLAFVFGALQLDRASLASAGIPADSVIGWFAEEARRLVGVADVARPSELAGRDTVTDHVARRWLHSFDSDSAAQLLVTVQYGGYWAITGAANHGTPHDYDTNVPLVFYGAPFRPGRIDAPARVVDLAPTIARAIGVLPLERVDGEVLLQALK